MSEGTTSEVEVIRLRQGIEMQMRRRILEAIELVLDSCVIRSTNSRDSMTPRPNCCRTAPATRLAWRG